MEIIVNGGTNIVPDDVEPSDLVVGRNKDGLYWNADLGWVEFEDASYHIYNDVEWLIDVPAGPGIEWVKIV